MNALCRDAFATAALRRAAAALLVGSVLSLDDWNEVPPGYASSLRSGDGGGVELK